MISLPKGVSLALNSLAGKINDLKKLKLIIALDGYSSSGKSTLAKDLSEVLGILHIDSGAMYRAVTLYFLQKHVSLEQEKEVSQALADITIYFERINEQNTTYLNGNNVEQAIRSMQVSNHVSDVAAISEVRRFLVAQQREIAENQSVIMDGRDIGSVVFPDADVKLFVDASLPVRAERRFEELKRQGRNITLEDVTSNLRERDRIDSSRSDSPLVQADDAIQLDTTNMNRSEMLNNAVAIILDKTNSKIA